jgi:uncharacterized LabA/DUF88 family protein
MRGGAAPRVGYPRPPNRFPGPRQETCGAIGPAAVGRDIDHVRLVGRMVSSTQALDHLTQPGDGERKDLYRIFVYDCSPVTRKTQYPISGQPLDFSKSPPVIFRLQFHEEVTRLRKVVLRLGRLQDSGRWRLKTAYINGNPVNDFHDPLTDNDFEYQVSKNGIEIRIGLDIASVVYKKQADQIVLVAGDADFLPAAKFARREGIDFLLDPMWNSIPREFHEHIDGLRSTCPRVLTAVERRRQQLQKAKELAEKETAPPSPESPANEDGSSGDAKVIALTFG